MPCLTLTPNLANAIDGAQTFLNSAFISAFLSALAGAGLGVWGAQRLAERSTKRKELLDALRQSNALIVLAHTITNQALSLKRQHISPLSTTYFEERKEAEATNDILLGGGVPKGKTQFKAEMVHITPLTVPVEALKSLTYSAQMMPGKALALVAMVEQSITEMTHAIRMRSDQIELFKSRGPEMPLELFVQSYFGLKRRDGNVDSLYHDLMVAVTQYTDDVAFFGAELADELQAHGALVRKRLMKLTKDAPKAATVDFSEARTSGLLPSRENYENWLSGFKKKD